MRPLCNFKLDRILKSFDGSCDKIIIMLDSDGHENLESRRVNITRHVPDDLETPVEIILAGYEIEEWICVSKNLKCKHSKPSDELKKEGYTKSSLPKYASELDFHNLQKNCRSFKDFLNALTP